MAGTWPLDGMEGELTAQRDGPVQGFAASQWQVGRFAGCIALTGLPEEARGRQGAMGGETANMARGWNGSGRAGR
ncbi:hypothetical protein KOPIIPEJ_03151 [Aeromonas dhakensis]